jgi:hypothetical protein
MATRVSVPTAETRVDGSDLRFGYAYSRRVLADCALRRPFTNSPFGRLVRHRTGGHSFDQQHDEKEPANDNWQKQTKRGAGAKAIALVDPIMADGRTTSFSPHHIAKNR